VPESNHEQIVAALRTLLQGIVADGGVTAWYTPDRVLRVPAFTESCLDSSLATIYCLSPADEDDEFRDSNRSVRSEMRVDLTVASQFTPSEDPFDQPDPDQWKIQSRLVRDVKKRIRSDYRLGGLCLWIDIPSTEYGAEQTDTLRDWAIAFLRLVIHYHYADTAP
jgi:hypothetical protein